jgi:hypothetical protein
MAVCELCYRPKTENDKDWELCYQSWVCPGCVRRAVLDDKALPYCVGGCYSGGKRDPRAVAKGLAPRLD